MRSESNAPATPCPVDWCDQIGQHVYDDERGPGASLLGVGHSRCRRHETGQDTGAEVGAEVYENDEGELSGPVVEIGVDGTSLELTSPAAVEEFISAIRSAAGYAFPAYPEHDLASQDAELEMEAAVEECSGLADVVRRAVFAPQEGVTTWEHIADAIRARYYVSSRPAAGEVTR